MREQRAARAFVESLNGDGRHKGLQWGRGFRNERHAARMGRSRLRYLRYSEKVVCALQHNEAQLTADREMKPVPNDGRRVRKPAS